MKYDKKKYAKDVQASKDEIASIGKPIFDAYADWRFANPSISKEEEKKNNCVNCGTVLRHEINISWDSESKESYLRDPFVFVQKKCPKCNPIVEEKVPIVEVKTENKAEPKDDRVNTYAVVALDKAYAGARQFLLDSFDQEYDELNRKMNVREAIKNLETFFLEWQKTGHRDIVNWNSAISVVDIIIAAGILHEKLREVESAPLLDNESEKEEEETD